MPALFALANSLVLPLWALMIFAPRARLTARVLESTAIVLPPIAVYALLVLPNLPSLLPIVARPELGAVAALLGSPAGAAAAWAHFLAFDLWVGRFIVLDARERRIPTPLLSAILVLSLLLGPLGLLAYLALRAELPQKMLPGWKRISEGDRPLAWLGAGSLLVAAVCSVLQHVDSRRLSGASVWLKPAKFGLSIGIFAFTLALLLRVLTLPERSRRRLVALIVGFTALELAIITLQAARGVHSHFNFSTVLDAVLFQVMGLGITVVTIAVGNLGVRAFRMQYRAEDRALGWGIRMGIAIMVVGSLIAFLMTRPAGVDLARIRAGTSAPMIGGHAVGASDDSAAMPVTRWNTRGGDLRAPHFIGLHALQIMPAIGWWLGRRRKLGASLAAKLTLIAGFGYGGVVLIALVQALRAQSLLAPDAITLAMVGALAIGCALAGAIVWWRAPRAESVESAVSREYESASLAR
jgi:Domain of unknown function (DUF4281)